MHAIIIKCLCYETQDMIIDSYMMI